MPEKGAPVRLIPLPLQIFSSVGPQSDEEDQEVANPTEKAPFVPPLPLSDISNTAQNSADFKLASPSEPINEPRALFNKPKAPPSHRQSSSRPSGGRAGRNVYISKKSRHKNRLSTSYAVNNSQAVAKVKDEWQYQLSPATSENEVEDDLALGSNENYATAKPDPTKSNFTREESPSDAVETVSTYFTNTTNSTSSTLSSPISYLSEKSDFSAVSSPSSNSMRSTSKAPISSLLSPSLMMSPSPSRLTTLRCWESIQPCSTAAPMKKRDSAFQLDLSSPTAAKIMKRGKKKLKSSGLVDEQEIEKMKLAGEAAAYRREKLGVNEQVEAELERADSQAPQAPRSPEVDKYMKIFTQKLEKKMSKMGQTKIDDDENESIKSMENKMNSLLLARQRSKGASSSDETRHHRFSLGNKAGAREPVPTYSIASLLSSSSTSSSSIFSQTHRSRLRQKQGGAEYLKIL